MCGIAGLFRAEGGITPEDTLAVEVASEALKHRGPDDMGLFSDAHVALGHRRLAIIDLSPTGHQPMTNEDGTVWLVYNGEIYNFKKIRGELASHHIFRSSSDTEVILHGYEEWGIEGLLARIQGMFAFAIYDKRADHVTGYPRPRLVLARDRFGIKPLYYHSRADRGLAFASEVKALCKAGLAPQEQNLEAIGGFLLLGSIPSPLTAIQGVRCLMPGEFIETDDRGVSTREYGRIDNSEVTESGQSTANQMRRALQASVEAHLISDVPVGVFLSGGVDSAVLVSMASRSHTRLSTLTVVFDEAEFSEAKPARAVAEHFHTDHTEIRVTSADFIASIPEMLSSMDQPTNDGLNAFIVSKAARRAGLKVALSGLGADEIFWGYRHYRWLVHHGKLIRRLAAAPAPVRAAFVKTAVTIGKLRGRENWMRLDVLRGGVTDENLYLAIRGFYAPEQVGRLLSLSGVELKSLMERHRRALRPEIANGIPSTRAFNSIELRRYMHDQLLRDTDVFSMSQSIEVRVPFLDPAVVTAARNTSAKNKLHRSINKPCLTRAANEELVSTAGRRRKKGFSFPLDKWMKRHSGELRERALQTQLVDRSEAARLWTAFEANRLHWSRAWALVVLGGRN